MPSKIYTNAVFGYREDTLENWQTQDPVLERGEPAIVRDGADGEWLKIGDGVTSWNNLPWKKGPVGSAGPKGEKGDTGATGAQGIQGEPGPKGDKGEKGDRGEQGPKGESGEVSKEYAHNTFANALKGKASGSPITIKDTSPLEHNVGVKLTRTPVFIGNGLLKSGYFKDTELGHIMSSVFTVATDGYYYLDLNVTDASKINVILWDDPNWLENMTQPGYFYKISETKFRTESTMPIGEYRIYFDTGFGLTAADILSASLSTDENAVAPLTDFSGMKVTVRGKNLFDKVAWIDYCNTISNEAKINDIYAGEECFSYKLWKKSQGLTNFSEINFKPNTQYVISSCCSFSLKDEATRTTGPVSIRYTDGSIQYVETKLSSDKFTEFTSQTKANKTVESITFTNWGSSLRLYCKYIQIEEGTIATEFEEYSATEYTANADGTVEGVKSIYPSMSLSADIEGVSISADYNRDINKAFAELQNALISLGGEI